MTEEQLDTINEHPEIHRPYHAGSKVKVKKPYSPHIQNITVSTKMSREDICELGRRKPYFTSVEFSCDIPNVLNENNLTEEDKLDLLD